MTPPIRSLIRAVSTALSVTPAQVYSTKTDRQFVLAREVVALVLHEHYSPKPTLADIAVAFGGRHHTAIMRMLKRGELRRHDDEFRIAYEAGVAALHGARPIARAIPAAELDLDLETMGRAVGSAAAE
jgi:chromosomal replication initiation ATPase DnaA